VNDAAVQEEEVDDAAVSADSGTELPQSPAVHGEQSVQEPDTFSAGLVTPQHSVVHGDNSTPTSANESGAMRFRNLDDIYDDTS
jgi:hypothetical protein